MQIYVLYTTAHVQVYMLAMCPCMYVKARDQHMSSFESHPFCSGGDKLASVGWILTPRNPACSISPALGLQMFTPTPGFLCHSGNQSLHLRCQHFSHWAFPRAFYHELLQTENTKPSTSSSEQCTTWQWWIGYWNGESGWPWCVEGHVVKIQA